MLVGDSVLTVCDLMEVPSYPKPHSAFWWSHGNPSLFVPDTLPVPVALRTVALPALTPPVCITNVKSLSLIWPSQV